MTIEHRTEAAVAQPPDVVHARLIELAERLRADPPIARSGGRIAQLLGLDGPIGIAVNERGADVVELETLVGRVRAAVAAEVVPTLDGTTLAMRVVLRPDGFLGSMALGMAENVVPKLRERFAEGVDTAVADFAAELSVPAEEWDVERVFARVPPLD